MLSASAAPRTYELYESAGNAHDDATRTINETTDIDTLNRQARELRKDLSAGHPMASALDEAIANRRKAIAEETEWSKFSARERELMVSAHEPTINVPESYTEPEPDEIHLAIMREVTALGGQMLSGRTAEIGVPPFDSAMPFRLDLV